MYGEYVSYKNTVVIKPTTPDIEGPFYKEGAPINGVLVDVPTCFLQGLVLATDGTPIEGALLDFWQADEKGVYDNEGFKLRGKQHSGPGGSYAIATVKPGHYQIGVDEYRCGHIHVKVTAPGFKPLTTQLYFPGDVFNDSDHWFDQSRVVVPIHTRTVAGWRFTFVLEKE